MTPIEKALYNQIHPLKLAVDISACIVSCVFLWRYQLLAAALIGFLPSIAITLVLVSFSDLEKRKASAFGRYVRANMTTVVTTQRITGQVIMWLAAWQHEPTLIMLGGVVIVLAWLSGVGKAHAATPRSR